jgi:hypothetical protein
MRPPNLIASFFWGLMFFLSGCVTTQYWVRPDTGIQETARDIQGVRPWLIEQPCMVGKGYTLSLDPPVGGRAARWFNDANHTPLPRTIAGERVS